MYCNANKGALNGLAIIQLNQTMRFIVGLIMKKVIFIIMELIINIKCDLSNGNSNSN